MDLNLDSQTLTILAGVAIIAAIALGVFFYFRQRTVKLQRRFGPEYARAVEQHGNQAKAESELEAREKRVRRFHIVPLTPPEAARFNEAWKKLQLRFVDNPQGSVAEADRLVAELMSKRGYPMTDFERNAADLSVHHPTVVTNYRAARMIAERDARGDADTEELRKAVVHYRALFSELLEVKADAPDDATAQKVKVKP